MSNRPRNACFCTPVDARVHSVVCVYCACIYETRSPRTTVSRSEPKMKPKEKPSCTCEKRHACGFTRARAGRHDRYVRAHKYARAYTSPRTFTPARRQWVGYIGEGTPHTLGHFETLGHLGRLGRTLGKLGMLGTLGTRGTLREVPRQWQTKCHKSPKCPSVQVTNYYDDCDYDDCD